MIARTAFGALAALTIGVGDASAQDNSGFQVSSEYAYFTASDHQSALRRAIEAELRSDPAVAAGDSYLSLDIIGPGVEAARALAPDNPVWPDSEAMTVNAPHEFADLAAPAAWRACAGFGVQALNQAQVYDWQAAIAALAEQFAEAE